MRTANFNRFNIVLYSIALALLVGGCCGSVSQTASIPPIAQAQPARTSTPASGDEKRDSSSNGKNMSEAAKPPSNDENSVGYFSIGGKEVSAVEFSARFPELLKNLSAATRWVKLVDADGKEICRAEFFVPLVIQGPNVILPTVSSPGYVGNSLIDKAN